MGRDGYPPLRVQGGWDRAGVCPTPMASTKGLCRRARPACSTSMKDVGTKTIQYIYDLATTGTHVIKVEKNRRTPLLVPNSRGPTSGPSVRVRLRNIGGFPGYADFLKAISDSAHEGIMPEMLEWYGLNFDVEDPGSSAPRQVRIPRQDNGPKTDGGGGGGGNSSQGQDHLINAKSCGVFSSRYAYVQWPQPVIDERSILCR